MSEQIIAILNRKLENFATSDRLDAETRRNVLKEELQYYVLNFIYRHPEYSKWVMYGGSALRIIHGLDRMSVDLDFEISRAVTEKFLEVLKKEIESHFTNTYNVSIDFLRVKINNERGLTLKFRVGKLIIDHASEWIDVKIDLNHFDAPTTIVREHRLINKDQFSFIIVTYNMSALMASKITAIFLREQRGIDKSIYDYKGRDIYDLLWYMEKKVVPDFDYMTAKKVDIKDPKTLFDRLTVDILNYERMDSLLKDDLSHLFENPFQFDNWLKTWRDSYLRLLDDYKIRTIKGLERPITIHQDSRSENFSFIYRYKTEEGRMVRIVYTISDYWIVFQDVDLTINIDNEISDIIEFVDNDSRPAATQKKLKRYATLFYQKTEKYFKKTNRVMLGDSIMTKVIRMTADNLNPKEQILLNKSALLSCELDDLLK